MSFNCQYWKIGDNGGFMENIQEKIKLGDIFGKLMGLLLHQ